MLRILFAMAACTLSDCSSLNIVEPSHAVLSTRAEIVPLDVIQSPSTQALIKRMLQIAGAEREDPSQTIMVGLAAPQIGRAKRIILVDVGANGKGGISTVKVFINPEITHYSGDQAHWYEGCYSTGYVTGIVPRFESVTVKAFDEEGHAIEDTYHGYVARIFQHEIDHLDGIRFPACIQNPEDLHWVRPDQFPLYRNQQAWRDWPVKCTWETWEAIQSGTYQTNPDCKDY